MLAVVVRAAPAVAGAHSRAASCWSSTGTDTVGIVLAMRVAVAAVAGLALPLRIILSAGAGGGLDGQLRSRRAGHPV
jgi:hypothetical protein